MTRRKAVAIVKPPVTWILVADGRRAQAYIRRKSEKFVPLTGNTKPHAVEEIVTYTLTPIAGREWRAQSPEQYEMEPNATGMVFESASSARSMGEPHIDVREKVEIDFCKTIAEQLNRAREEKAFDRLVLIAPAKMLGAIRKQLDKKTLKCVVAEMPKDLTHCGEGALLDRLKHSIF